MSMGFLGCSFDSSYSTIFGFSDIVSVL
jgi:hypothetical protein